MSQFFGIIPISAGVREIADIGASGLSGVLVGNESGLTTIVTLQGANISRSLYPGTVDWFAIPANSAFNGNVQFDPSANLNNVVSWPGSYLQIDTFGPGEKPSGVYPMSLTRNSNVGNTVNVANGAANEILNIGNGPATPVFFVQKSGDPAASEMTNDNTWTIGTAANPGTYSFQNGRFVLDGLGDLILNNLTLLLENGSIIQDTTNTSGATVLTAAPTGQLTAVLLANTGALQLGNAAGSDGHVDIDIAGDDKLGTTGDAALFMPFRGSFKLIYMLWTGYSNGGAVNWVLPVAFSKFAYFWVGETQGGTVTFVSGGVGRVCSVQNTISSAGGTQNATTNMKQWTNGMTRGAFDTVQLNFPSGATGIMVAVGS